MEDKETIDFIDFKDEDSGSPEKDEEVDLTVSERPGWLTHVVTWLITLLAAAPFFIIVLYYMPEIKLIIANKYYFYLQHFVTGALVIAISWILVRLFRKIITGVVIMVLVALIINLFRNQYSFPDLYNDYKALIVFLAEEPVQVPFIPESATFRNSNLILKAITSTIPDVRNFAVTLGTKNFSDPQLYNRYGDIIRYFSIFKEVKSRWRYVHDPDQDEYYAPASETIKHMSGDCDDYSIVTVTLIKAVGGKARIIRTEGHLYPEVNIGKKQELQEANFLVRELFSEELAGKQIFYHEDKDGNIWLNFDYTEKYPGGHFLNPRIIDILNV